MSPPCMSSTWQFVMMVLGDSLVSSIFTEHQFSYTCIELSQLIKLSSLWSKIYDYMYYYKGLYLWIYVSMKLSVLLNPQALMSTYIYETTVHVEVLTALYPCCLFSFVYCVCDNFRLCMSFIHVALSCELFCLCIISLYAVVA